MKITITARTKMVYTTDSTGKRLSEEEMEEQRHSSMLGSLDVEIHSEGVAVLKFDAKVIAGNTQRFVSLPRTKGRDGQWHDVFTLGEDLKEAIRKQGLRAMTQAESDRKTRKLQGGMAVVETEI